MSGIHNQAPLCEVVGDQQSPVVQELLHQATPVGLEATRGNPIGLAGRRLGRSAKVSMWRRERESQRAGCKRQRGSACQPKTHEGLNYSGVDNQGQLVKLSVTSSHPWCRSCHTSDTCGMRTHAGRPHRLSRPTPWPLGQSVNAAMNTEESFGGLHTKEGFGF